MFYLITSRAVRRRKDELGAFGPAGDRSPVLIETGLQILVLTRFLDANRVHSARKRYKAA